VILGSLATTGRIAWYMVHTAMVTEGISYWFHTIMDIWAIIAWYRFRTQKELGGRVQCYSVHTVILTGGKIAWHRVHTLKVIGGRIARYRVHTTMATWGRIVWYRIHALKVIWKVGLNDTGFKLQWL